MVRQHKPLRQEDLPNKTKRRQSSYTKPVIGALPPPAAKPAPASIIPLQRYYSCCATRCPIGTACTD